MESADRLVLIDGYYLIGYDVNFFFMLVKKVGKLFKRVFREPVVRIEENYILALSHVESEISAGGYAYIFLVDDKLEERIFLAVFTADSFAAVIGTVNYKQYFKFIFVNGLRDN